MDRRVGNKPELNQTAISWKCALIVPAFVFRVWWIRRRDLFTDNKVFRRRSVLCENAYTDIVGGEPRCLMCLKAQVWARDVAGDCDAGGSCSDFLWHVWRSSAVCSVTLVMWLLSLFVMFSTRANEWLFLLCIVHFLKRGYFCRVEKQKRRVMSDVIYFLSASTTGAATYGHKPKLRGF